MFRAFREFLADVWEFIRVLGDEHPEVHGYYMPNYLRGDEDDD